MDDITSSIILGIVQGITEFLPISSSGHLELAKVFLGTNNLPKESLLMTVTLHAATALSTLVVFRKEIKHILLDLLTFRYNKSVSFCLKIGLSMLPAVFVGLCFEKQIEALFSHNILLVGVCLIITGFLLLVASKAKENKKQVSFLHAGIIGISQAVAILPGISRSGATISTSVLLGIDKTQSARFSFLMVVPLIFGKIVKDILFGDLNFNNQQIIPLTIGFLVAFFVGLLACTWMIQIVKRSKLNYFSLYCFIVGIAAIIWTIF